MERGRTRSIRFALALAIVAALAAVVAATATGMSFDDAAPCPDTHPLFVCPDGTVGAPYSIQLQARGGCTPYKFVNTTGSLPPGLSLSSSGVISGTPTTAGGSRFWLQLQSGCAGDPPADREFSLGIKPRVIVTTESAGAATVGVAYNLSLAAQMMYGPGQLVAPSSPLTWSVVAGTLPPGLALDPASGVLSGAPTTEGSFGFTVRAALADGRADTKGLSINVRQPVSIEAPEPFAPAGAPTAWEVGVPFRASLAATGGSGTYTWSLAEGALPDGLVLAADGSVVGRPHDSGPSSATIRLADDEGRTADYTVAFVVAPRLAFATRALRQARLGRPYRAKLVATGGILPKTWKVVHGKFPKGIHLDRTLGIISGTPLKAGRYRLRFQVVDAFGVKAGRTFKLIVRVPKNLRKHTRR